MHMRKSAKKWMHMVRIINDQSRKKKGFALFWSLTGQSIRAKKTAIVKLRSLFLNLIVFSSKQSNSL